MGIDIAAIAAQVGTGVVGVEAPSRHRRPGRRGTGVVVADGRVLTTAHNIGRAGGGAEGTNQVQITFADGRRASGRVAGMSGDLDLAVITVDTTGATPLVHTDDPAITVGQDIVAIGAADGVPRITVGVVATTSARFTTATGSPVVGVVEHTAPLPAGSSGGPVLDSKGTFIAMDANRVGRGFYQAVPVDAAFRATLDLLAEGRQPPTRRLGIAVVDGHRAKEVRAAAGLKSRDGVLVTGVDPDGPAGRAGIGRGDVISAIDDHAVSGAEDLLLALRGAGDTAVVTVGRGADADRQATVSFADPPTGG